MTGSGETCSTQRTEGGWLVNISNIPPMGYTTVLGADSERPAVSPQSVPFQFSENGIETPYYTLEWNGQGHLTGIYDKAAGREVLLPGQCGNVFEVFEDKPKSRHEAWDIDLYYLEKRKVVGDCAEVRLVEAGPLRAVVRFTWNYMNSSIVQSMVLYSHSRRIEFQTTVDWNEQRQLLKVAFPVNIRATEATYDIQFGNVKRPTHWNTSWDYARFETVGHQWADLSERGYGVSLLNDCKYGYDIKDHVMRLTLIKSALIPDPTADLGEHQFTYALYPHQGDWFEGETVQEAWCLNNPPSAVLGKPSVSKQSLFTVSAPNVFIDAVKLAEEGEGLIIRLHEFACSRGCTDLSCGLPIAIWEETDLLENAIPGGSEGQGDIQFEIAPYEIKTFRLQF